MINNFTAYLSYHEDLLILIEMSVNFYNLNLQNFLNLLQHFLFHNIFKRLRMMENLTYPTMISKIGLKNPFGSLIMKSNYRIP